MTLRASIFFMLRIQISRSLLYNSLSTIVTSHLSTSRLLTLLISSSDPPCHSGHFSLFSLQSPPLRPYPSALPYVTGAHIRENNLWLTWIRDAAQFPMIHFWYENIRKYLDKRGLSDQCCQSVVGKHVSAKPVCRMDPWESHEMRKKVKTVKQEVRRNDAEYTITMTKVLKCPQLYFIFFFLNNISVILHSTERSGKQDVEVNAWTHRNVSVAIRYKQLKKKPRWSKNESNPTLTLTQQFLHQLR